MNHDQFVGHVQHLAHLPSRGDAETIIRATFETLGERLTMAAADHVAAQLPPELGRHLVNRRFEHLSLHDFTARVAERENADAKKAMFHARCVIGTLRSAVSPGVMRKLHQQLPEEFGVLLDEA